jgi:hypothetical protein
VSDQVANCLRHLIRKARDLLRDMLTGNNTARMSVSFVYWIGHRLGLDEATIHEVVGNKPWLGPVADAVVALSMGDKHGDGDDTLISLLTAAGCNPFGGNPEMAIAKVTAYLQRQIQVGALSRTQGAHLARQFGLDEAKIIGGK